MSSEILNPATVGLSEDGGGRAGVVVSADVRSTDGKLHRITFDSGRLLLEFTLISGNDGKSYSMVKDMNELLSVRGTPVIMRSGLPVDLNEKARQADTPNSLFFYFAEKKDSYRWRIREVVTLFTTSTEKKKWLEMLSTAVKGLTQRPKTLLIFVNPYGGKGKAKKIYAKQVQLILELADIKCDVLMTQRANHAFDHLKQLNLDQWNSVDGVVSVGGDGLFNECLSAIVCRTQEDAGKDIADVNVDSLCTPRMRFGIIGAGSANSIVSSVHGTDDCPTAAIHVAMGSQCHVDVCTVHRGKELMRISANAISYGWLGDLLSDSERYRFMGPFRYQYSGLRTTIRNPSYFGRVSFRLSPEDEQRKDSLHLAQCTQPCSACQKKEVNPVYPYHVQTDFTHVICCVIPCVSPFTPYGLAPYAGVGDGSMDLALVPRVSRCDNMKFIRRVAMHGGKHVVARNNNLNVFRVSQWAYTPAALLDGVPEDKTSKGQGAWNLDGEIMVQPPDATFHFRLHPRLIRYFGRELDIDAIEKTRRGCCGFCDLRKKHVSKIVVIDTLKPGPSSSA